MANHEADIVLIRKYLNGELDARAMHQLEARAQDDPFLADAIEGYEKVGRNQQPALADLSKRLRQRIEEKKVKRLIPFRTLAIAASILVVFTIGWLMLSKTQTTAPPSVATVKPVDKVPAAQPVAKETTATTQLIAKAPAPVIRPGTVVKAATAPATPQAAAAPVIAEPAADNVIANATAKKADLADTTPLNELVVMNYKPSKKSDTLKEVNADKAKEFYGYTSPQPAAPLEQKLNAKAKGVAAFPGSDRFRMTSPNYGNMYLQGRVIDEIDGRPLSGVAVKAFGTTFGTVTDRNGNFSIPSDGVKRGIVASRLGYNTTKVSVPGSVSDSLKIISLAPADIPTEAMLSNNAKDAAAAHPQMGWSKYDKYLNGASVSPDHQTGTVTLSFWVDKTGAISNITIKTSLSDDADKKAINLVKKGPKWAGNANGKSEQVELSINF